MSHSPMVLKAGQQPQNLAQLARPNKNERKQQLKSTMAEETKEDQPLQNEWVLWEHKSAGGSKNPNAWKENMNELCHFKTVQDFWRYFNHIPRPSEVFFDGECKKKVGPDGRTVEEFSLFKKGIEPEWGDPANATGGEWFCRQTLDGDILDLYWLNMVMGVIGETIEDGVDEERTYKDYVNGCRVIDKSRAYPMFKLELWVNTQDEKIKTRLRAKLFEVMTDGQPASKKIHPKFEWKDHSP